ncbi:hypothetical protein [Legionella impletisoli]|uniref:Uncharacterized protein n=1 Tax=Legionella impletisoli TaxID=343510 RepID=A0A917JVF7_9GAMM|nr:hypothetical protein [Legionella impletisoli]GGI87879.1 hypothetical protein GCM10007966_15800 [Legionella impletisoli]
MTAYNFSNLITAINCELEMQCIMALEAFKASRINLKEYKETCLNRSTDLSDFNQMKQFCQKASEGQYKFFRNIHSLIVCHANISKLLHWKGKGFRGKNKFPGSDDEKDKIKKHLSELRKSLNSFVNNDRTIRDYVEHFDECLINSACQSDISNLRFCHSSERVQRANSISKEQYLREIIYDDMKYAVSGKDYDLKGMIEDVEKLQQKIHALKEFGAII